MHKKTRGGFLPILLAVLTVAVLSLVVGTLYAALKDTTSVVENDLDPATVSCEVVETFTGTQKTNVKLKNTGDIPAYLRAKVVINWVDSDGNVAYRPGSAYQYSVTLASPLNWTRTSNLSAVTEGYWYYNGIVQPDGMTDVLIASAVENLSPTVAADPQYHLQITVLAEAVQAAPIGAVEEVWHMTFNGSTWSAVS